VDDRDLLFYVETVFLYGGLMAFAFWEVMKMRRHAKNTAAKNKADKDRAAESTCTQDSDNPPAPDP